MAKAVKRAIGKQKVVPFICPVCFGAGERQIGKDISCPPKMTKVTSLCYQCGYSGSIYQ